MRLLILLATASLTAVNADFYPTNPTSSSVIPAGTPFAIAWSTGPNPPALTSIRSTKIELCMGTETLQKCIYTLGDGIPPLAMQHTATIPRTVGPSSRDWFLRFSGDGRVMNWSARFTLTGASGPNIVINGNTTRVNSAFPEVIRNATNVTSKDGAAVGSNASGGYTGIHMAVLLTIGLLVVV